MTIKRIAMVLTSIFLLPAGATAAPIFTANSVSLSYGIAPGGGGNVETYSFLGPNLNITGSASSISFGGFGTYPYGTSVNFPIAVIADDSGFGGSGHGTAGGITYPSLSIFSGSLLTIGPLTLYSGMLSVTVPETLTGSISAVSFGTSAFSADFNVPGLLTIGASQNAPGSILITSIQFNSIPEPSTALISGCGIAALFAIAYTKRRCL